uniref:RIN4 pathogenic type III effector avirulence factor Avr cleavage site domain-containing protein n=1 Tax=Opuntia streptacantha TaxID=393608 RepID=A0A7C8Z3B4_OPUST
MAAKVPKFGAWEGGENFTVCFDNARKVKYNGPMINPNDPLENPGMFTENGIPAGAPPIPSRAELQGQQAQVPQFGAWDKGDSVGYTMYFENARKTKYSGGPTVTEGETQVKRDAQAQPRPAKIKPEPQEARVKVPQFGGWEGGGEVAYTACFDNVRKKQNGPTNAEEPSNEPQMNRVVASRNEPHLAREARSKVPQFGAWNGGENVAYSACFDNARKNMNGGIGPVSVEPQLNRDAGATNKARSEQRSTREDGHVRNASRGSVGSMAASERHGRQTPGGQSPLHPKGGKTPSKHGSRGSQHPEKVATIPPFGVWNQDPSQAEGFTGTFERAKVERLTPLHKNAPASYNRQTPQSNQEAKKGCCFPWF